MSDGLPNVVVTDLVLHAPSGRLVAATYGRGLYSIDLPDPPEPGCGSRTQRSRPRCALRLRGPSCGAGVQPWNGCHPPAALEYGHFGGASSDTLWNGTLMPGDSVQLVLHPLPPQGWSDFTVLLTEVDGQSRRAHRQQHPLRTVAQDVEWRGHRRVVHHRLFRFPTRMGAARPLDRVLHRSGWLPPSATSVDTLCVPADACLEFEVHRDQLSSYESLMADCLSPLTFSLWEVGTDAPFFSAPQSGVVDTYTLCTDNLTSGGCMDAYVDNYDVHPVFDDGTCEPVCYPLSIAMNAGCAPGETSWSLHPDGLAIAPGGVPAGSAVLEFCLNEGCREFQLVDLAADGWDSSCGATHLTLTLNDDTLYQVEAPTFTSAWPWKSVSLR